MLFRSHSLSAFAWLHPHVWEYATAAQLSEFTIDLIHEPPLNSPRVPKPLRLACEELQLWFQALLTNYGFEPHDLQSARLTFGAFGSHPHALAATADVIAASGRAFRYLRGWPPNSALHRT